MGMSLLNYILGSKDEEDEKPSMVKAFLKNPDDHKILIETHCDEIVIRIRKNGHAGD